MMNKFKYIWAVAALAVFAILSCSKEEEEEEYRLNMVGELEYDIPRYVLLGEYVTVEAGGILAPENPVIKWVAPTVVTDTIVGKKVTFRFPADSLGTFVVSASAHHEGYYTTSASVQVSTIDTTFNGYTLKGLKRSGKSIVDKRDNHKYAYVTIGNLDWFSQNLAYAGAGVPFQRSPITWDMFGYFYDWKDATGGKAASGLGCGPQGACPEGWSVPTNEDWEDLASAMNDGHFLPFADKWEGIGEKASANVTFQNENMWGYSPDNEHTNDFGWNAIPLGYVTNGYKRFESEGTYGFWWSSSEKDSQKAYYRYIYSDLSQFPMNYTGKTGFGVNVRCVRLAER